MAGDGDWRLHPLHLLMLGLCMIPVSLWQILAIDFETPARQRAEDAANPDSAPLGHAGFAGIGRWPMTTPSL